MGSPVRARSPSDAVRKPRPFHPTAVSAQHRPSSCGAALVLGSKHRLTVPPLPHIDHLLLHLDRLQLEEAEVGGHFFHELASSPPSRQPPPEA